MAPPSQERGQPTRVAQYQSQQSNRALNSFHTATGAVVPLGEANSSSDNALANDGMTIGTNSAQHAPSVQVEGLGSRRGRVEKRGRARGRGNSRPYLRLYSAAVNSIHNICHLAGTEQGLRNNDLGQLNGSHNLDFGSSPQRDREENHGSNLSGRLRTEAGSAGVRQSITPLDSSGTIDQRVPNEQDENDESGLGPFAAFSREEYLDEDAVQDPENGNDFLPAPSYIKRRRSSKEGWEHVTRRANGSITCNYCHKPLNVLNNHTRVVSHLVEKCCDCPTPTKERLKRKNFTLRSVGGVRSRAACRLSAAPRPRGREHDIVRGNAIEGPENSVALQESVSSGYEASLQTSSRRTSSSGGSVSVANRRLSHLRNGKRVPLITECSESEANEIIEAIIDFVIRSGSAFSLLNSSNGNLSPLAVVLQKLRPGFVERYLPNSSKLSGEYLDTYYNSLYLRVSISLKRTLSAGFGSLMFDGWSDINGSPVVNVLLRVETPGDSWGKTFFLNCLYTGSQRVGGDEYVRLLELTMEKFGGFSRICAVTSDNTSCCVNARKALTNKYRGTVSMNNQAHVADLLMEDFDKLDWVRQVIRRVANVSAVLNNHKKLLERFKAKMLDYNTRVKRMNNAARDRYISLVNERGHEDNPSHITPPQPRRTAVSLKQTSNTRFAYAEGVLDSFIRSHPVLCILIKEDDFESNLYTCQTPAQIANRSVFVATIEESGFLDSVKDVHRLLLPMRRYLREFDANNVMLSSIVPLTLKLESEVYRVSERFGNDRKEQVRQVFRRRKGEENSSVRVKLLTDVHYTAWLLDPCVSPRNVTPYARILRRHALNYCKFQSPDSGNVDENEAELSSGRILAAYLAHHAKWSSQIDSLDSQRFYDVYKNNPGAWWFAECTDKDLQEFALRTLACSPSSCAAERSFSAQKRIHSKERNRLSREKVRKIMFCYWNVKLLHQMSSGKPLTRKDYFEAQLEASRITRSALEGGSGQENLGMSRQGENDSTHEHSNIEEEGFGGQEFGEEEEVHQEDIIDLLGMSDQQFSVFQNPPEDALNGFFDEVGESRNCDMSTLTDSAGLGSRQEVPAERSDYQDCLGSDGRESRGEAERTEGNENG